MNPQTLPFNQQFQSNLLSLLITDYEFLRSVVDDLTPNLLDAGEGHIKLLKCIIYLYRKTKRPLTEEIVKNTILQGKVNNIYTAGDIFGMNSIIDSGKFMTNSEKDFIKEKVFEFMKTQTMALAFSKSLSYFEKGDFDEVYKLVGDAYKKSYGKEYNIGINYSSEQVFTRYMDAPRKGIWSTGFPTLDSYLGGGIARKECATILSPSGRGKTALLCNFAVSAAKQNMKTLFITLEMSELQIAQRFDSIISGFSSKELMEVSEAKVSLQKKLNTLFSGNINNLLTVKGFDRGTLSLGGLETYLEKYSIEFGSPHVIVLDWLGCMRMPSGFEKKHEALAEVGDTLVNYSRQFNCSLLTAHQTNRSAVGADTYSYDSISESFASIFGFDIVLGLGSSNKAQEAGKRTLTIQKSRVGPDSVFVGLQGDQPNQPLTFKFVEAIPEEGEEELLRQENKK